MNVDDTKKLIETMHEQCKEKQFATAKCALIKLELKLKSLLRHANNVDPIMLENEIERQVQIVIDDLKIDLKR